MTLQLRYQVLLLLQLVTLRWKEELCFFKKKRHLNANFFLFR